MDIGNVVFRKQRSNVKIDFNAGVQRQVEVRVPAAFQRFHGPPEQFRVKRKSDLLDLAALRVAEKFACAANLQVVCRQGESGAEIFKRVDGLQPLRRVGRQLGYGRRYQVGIGAMVRPPHATPQLMKLRQAKTVCTVDDDRVGRRHVDAALDNCGAQKNVKAPMIESPASPVRACDSGICP